MKKNLFFSLTVLVLFLSVSHLKVVAQNTAPYWSLAGNSNATNSSKLGTTNSFPLRIVTKNLERIRVDTLGRVGIGTSNPTYKLHVAGNGLFTSNVRITSGGLYSISTTVPAVQGNNSNGNGIYGLSTEASSYGVYGNNPGTDSYFGGGVLGRCVNGRGVKGIGAFGVQGEGDYAVTGSSTDNSFGRGVFGIASGKASGVFGQADSGYAVIGVAFERGGTGVFGNGKKNGVYGIGDSVGVYGTTNGASNSYAGYFVGKVFSSGGYFTSSDRRLKQDITEVTNAMDIINRLQPRYYNYRQDGDYKFMNLPQGKHYGLIAQDVEEVLPDLVNESKFEAFAPQKPKKSSLDPQKIASDNKVEDAGSTKTLELKGVNYIELIPLLIKAVQEVNKKNETLQSKLEEMQKEINELKLSNKGNATIADTFNGSLEQNTPNPFYSATIIRYHVPQNINNAKVVITDMNGRVIKSINLTNRGIGELNLNSGTLSAGSYNYTLWMDGKKMDSKTMIITR